MSSSSLYTDAFYSKLKPVSNRSANAIVPLLQRLAPFQSVCDVGCGPGSWLKGFADHGITDYLGLDGDYVIGAGLVIPAEHFRAQDLSKPFTVERQFDLAVSLEVAEHLPSARAEGFIADITRLAPLVLFSAAIPFQGGTGHINEQWQDYWVELFARRDYQVFDVIRHQVWDDERVLRFYRQNIFVFCRRDHVANCPGLSAAHSNLPLSIVHPMQYALRTTELGMRDSITLAWQSVKREIARRLPGSRANTYAVPSESAER